MSKHILQAVDASREATGVLRCESLHLVVWPAGSGEEIKSELGDREGGGGPPMCCMLGVPAAAPVENISHFVESYLAEIVSLTIVDEADAVCPQRVAVLAFRDVSSLRAFCHLYNDLHFPECYDQPACLVFPIDRFDIIDSFEAERPTPAGQGPPLLLPHCPECLRRVAPGVSALPDTSRLPVLPSHTGGGCAVCRAYSAPPGEGVRRCVDCGLGENIWVCMACARGGCGRYTYMHAKEHYHATGHPFSLELATGRIWNYVHDAFVHQECISGYDERVFTASPMSAGETAEHCARKPPPHSADAPPPDAPLGAALYGGAGGALDEITTQKISNVVGYYESLMQSQLADQSLHYEKLLARKTVQLLEREVVGAAREGGGREPPAGAESKAEEPSMGDIERSKLEISSLEQDYVCLLERLRDSEERTRKGRQENKMLMSNQKTMQERAAQLKAMAAEADQRRLEKVSELQEQIRDLEFFVRTQTQVESSAMRDDIQQGSVVVVPGAAQTPPASGSRGAGRHRNSSGKRR